MNSLAFACEWAANKEKTWSHIPFSLLNSLKEQHGGIEDLDVSLHPLANFLLKVLGLRYNTNLHRWTSQYKLTSTHATLLEWNMRRLLRHHPSLSAVISISDLLSLDSPAQYIYYDLCAAELQRILDDPFQGRYESVMYSKAVLRRKIKRQKKTYMRCKGLFAMSNYAACSVSEHYGIETQNIRVVHAGVNVDFTQSTLRPQDKAYLLFVGRDFFRKGGDLLLEAFRHVQKKYDIDLVIAGPKAWMYKEAIPEGVIFLGDVSPKTLQSYFEHAELFVMPSYFEAFGIVFAEALCHGVPVVARNSCAMPEIVQEGVNGYLMEALSSSSEELSYLISKAIENTEMKKNTNAQKVNLRSYYSWQRVSADMLSTVFAGLS